MKKIYTMQEACKFLAIDNATLYRWMKRASIEATQDEHDKRVYHLTDEQVKELASLHRKTKTRSKPVEKLQDTLLQRIETLEREVVMLRETVARLEATRTITTRPKKQSHPTATTGAINAIPANMPPDAMPLYLFARENGLDRRKVLDHMLRNNQEHMAIEIAARPGQYERYLTSDQQRAILDYWTQKGTPHTS